MKPWFLVLLGLTTTIHAQIDDQDPLRQCIHDCMLTPPNTDGYEGFPQCKRNCLNENPIPAALDDIPTRLARDPQIQNPFKEFQQQQQRLSREKRKQIEREASAYPSPSRPRAHRDNDPPKHHLEKRDSSSTPPGFQPLTQAQIDSLPCISRSMDPKVVRLFLDNVVVEKGVRIFPTGYVPPNYKCTPSA